MNFNTLLQKSKLIYGNIKSRFFKTHRQIFRLSFFKDKFIFWVLVSSLFLNLFIFGLLIYNAQPSQFLIPVSFSSFSGVALGRWLDLLKLPFSGLFLIVLNGYLGYFLYDREKILSYFLVGFLFLAQLLILIQSLALINLMGQ